MASTEALIKYYDCLKDSFNKIQVKDNKSALVNAALRPKIRDELVKSRELLVSYLNYIQVFTLIYSEKFTTICISIICPFFKENRLNKISESEHEEDKDVAHLIHKTVKEILKSKPELVEEFIHCLNKFFPNSYSDERDIFLNYLSNSLEICAYIRGQPLTNLVAKILDRLNPPSANIALDDESKVLRVRDLIYESYELLYIRLDSLEKRQKDNFSAAILAAFTREFLTSENVQSLNYLVLYVCSIDIRLLDLFINLLWASFTDTNRPFEERRASIEFACSFMSRATYVELDKVLNYLETAAAWCENFLDENRSTPLVEARVLSETNELFYASLQSILYLITQRYREMYEVDSIERLKKLNLDRFLNSPLKPLEICDDAIEQRFREVASLYDISSLKSIDKSTPKSKKRRTTNDLSVKKRPVWKVPFKESDQSVPKRIQELYRNYFDHRNFTVYRE